MTRKNDVPDRQSARAQHYDYRRSGYYFVTICTHGRQHTLGQIVNGQASLSSIGQIASAIWCTLPERFPCVALDEYIFMPNHMHGIVVIKKPSAPIETSNIPERFKAHMKDLEQQRLAKQDPSDRHLGLGEILRTFKAASSYRIHREGVPYFSWQPGFHDVIITNQNELEIKRRYTIENPSHWREDELFNKEDFSVLQVDNGKNSKM